MKEREQQTVVLLDGRTLGYAEYGDPHGYPVLSFHGTMSSRRDIDFADTAAHASGVRILGVDRPGMGLSTYQPRRTLADWTADIVEFSNQLNLPDFGIYAWSAGGQYALKIAASLPGKVTAVAIVGGPKPYETVHGMQGIPGIDRTLMIGARYVPALIRAAIHYTVVRASDTKIEKLLREDMSAPDVTYLDALTPGHAVALTRESVRQGTKGPVADFRILGEPWGFPLTDVTAPVDVWIGEHDHLGPPNEARDLTAALPNAYLHEIPDTGHISLGPTHITDILATLKRRTEESV